MNLYKQHLLTTEDRQHLRLTYELWVLLTYFGVMCK